jgi:hypothetical protein
MVERSYAPGGVLRLTQISTMNFGEPVKTARSLNMKEVTRLPKLRRLNRKKYGRPNP